jgi:TP901 family phage tail tape measure protein
MANRSVVVNFMANTSAYVAGVGRATGATQALSGAATMALAKIAGPAALVYGMSQAAKASLQFQDEMTKLKTQIGLTNPEIDQMRRAALSLGGETTKAPQELAEATFFIASAGLRGAAAMDVLRASAKLSAIGLGETKVIADLLTSAVNAYGTETLSAAAASDALVSAVRLGKLEADQLSGAMGSILPVASAMGVSFSEVAGMMAAMSRTGTDAATASTQLTQIMMGLMRPSNQATEALHDMGITSDELRATIQEDGLWAALMMLHDAVDGNVQALGEVFPNIRAFKGVADLLGPGLETNARLLNEMAEATGLADDAFEAFSGTTRAEMQRMSSELERTQIAVGDRTTGIVHELTRLVRTSVQVIGDAAERSQDAAGLQNRIALSMAESLRRVERETRGLSAADREAALQSDALRMQLRNVTEQYSRLTLEEQANAFSKDVRMGLMRGEIGLNQELTDLFIAQAIRLALLSDEQSGLNADAARYQGLADRYAKSVEGQTSALDDLFDSLGMTREEMDLLTRAIDEQRRAQLDIAEPIRGAIRAQRDYQAALETLISVQGDAEASSDDLMDAVLDVMIAEIERQAAMEKAGLVTEGFIGTLEATITELGLTEDQAARVRDRLGELGIAMDKLDGRVVKPVVDVQVNLPSLPAGLSWGSGGLPMVPGASVSMPTMPEANIPGRARGGPVSAGRAYIVGEEGPELIVPGASGHVMTAPETRAALSGGGWTVNVHMPPGADGEQVVAALRRWERANGPVPVGVR